MLSRIKNFKDRVLFQYKLERAKNRTAKDALCTARYEARFGQGSHCQAVLPLTRGTAYEGEEERVLPNGWKIKFETQYDTDHEPPWEDCDGMGEIKESRGYYTPGEYGEYDDWILYSDRGFHLYYDWRATLPIAIKEGWDAPPYGTGTKQEQAMRAMRKTFEFLHGWCNDSWWYVGLIVTLYDENGEELGEDSCWGFESEGSDAYITEQMRSWAAHMIVAARKKQRAERKAQRIANRFADAMECGL